MVCDSSTSKFKLRREGYFEVRRRQSVYHGYELDVQEATEDSAKTGTGAKLMAKVLQQFQAPSLC